MKIRTLTLIFDIQYEVGIRLQGFSFKKLSNHQHFIRSDAGGYALDCLWHIDKNTAKPEFTYLVKHLKTLYRAIPFNKINIKGAYFKTGEEILNSILDD